MTDVALAAQGALGCEGCGCVDTILDNSGTPWVLEINTIPGMTESSLMPVATEAAGIGLADLAEIMAATA